MKPGVLFANFGGPTADAELEPFLFNLLSDVLPGPSWLSSFMARRIAPARAKQVREPYRRIGWSPLVADSQRQLDATLAILGEHAPPGTLGMMFTPPSMAQGITALLERGCDALVVVGLYPHFSFATAGSSYDMVHAALAEIGKPDLPVHYADCFFDRVAYHEAVAATIEVGRARTPGEGPIHLLFSAHGIPLSFVRKGDPYPDHVRESVRGSIKASGWTDPWSLAWQSRLGPNKWLSPSVDVALERLAAEGVKRLLVVPVSFVGEHIETLDEIDREYAEAAHALGIEHFGRAPALGLTPRFIECLAEVTRDALTHFDRYHCVRCLVPKPDAHRRRKACPNCGFRTPPFLTEFRGR